jgi:hypothetical protein
MEKWRRILFDYDTCKCGNPKLKRSKRCRECYSSNKRGNITRAFNRAKKSDLCNEFPVT